MEENNELSGAFDKLGEILSSEDGQKQIADIISMFSDTISNDNDTHSDDSPVNISSSDSLGGISSLLGNMPDMEFWGKAQRIMSAMGKSNNSNTAFLKALKPYLHTERRQKVDGAIKLLGLASVFREFGGNILNNREDD